MASPHGYAIVTHDQAALRAAPSGSGRTNAVLYQGETLEVRGARMDWLQVWDYRRERGGYVRASQVRRVELKAHEAPELLSVLRFLRDAAGSEALGIGFAAAYVEAAPPEALNGPAGVEAMETIGTLAERLGRRATGARDKATQALLAAHMEVAARYGVKFVSHERDGKMVLCSDGASFRRVLAMRSTPEQRASAALALTRAECSSGDLHPAERRKLDEWRAEILDQVDEASLRPYLANRIQMRRAAVWSALAWQHARIGADGAPAAKRAIAALAAIDKAELTDEDRPTYTDASMRVSASRWAAAPAPQPASPKRPRIITVAGAPGETCVHLVQGDDSNVLARRCTYSVVWPASATLNKQGTILALAIQPTESWRELWLFFKNGKQWIVRVIPPSPDTPGVGYVNLDGWASDGGEAMIIRAAFANDKNSRILVRARWDDKFSGRLDTRISSGYVAANKGGFGQLD